MDYRGGALPNAISRTIGPTFVIRFRRSIAPLLLLSRRILSRRAADPQRSPSCGVAARDPQEQGYPRVAQKACLKNRRVRRFRNGLTAERQSSHGSTSSPRAEFFIAVHPELSRRTRPPRLGVEFSPGPKDHLLRGYSLIWTM